MKPSPTLKLNSSAIEDIETPKATRAGVAGSDKSRRVHVEVFGCQMNKLDAELMMGTLLESGYELTDRVEDAGVALYVTCSVRRQSENRVFSKIGGLKSRKRSDPGFVVGLLGCMAQNCTEEILERYRQVDVVCGTAEFLRLPDLIDRARRRRDRRKPVVAIDLDTDLKFKRSRNLGPTPAQAYVSVMRGCDQACTFCIVPTTRGKEISRSVLEIVDEVRALADTGTREVTLLGQTVNSYGKRLAPGRQIGLQHLLSQLNKIGGLERIRFITSHPRFMNDDLIDAMGELDKVCEYLHLPVQSGSDEVLRRMLRTYSIERYRNVIARCRERIRGFALATDFIVGFPGETDADFQMTCDLLREMRYQNSFVFRYSPRPGTRADDMPDDVPEEVKQERQQTLLALQEKLSHEIYRERLDQVEEVLVEGPSRSDASRWTGRNRAHQIVVFPIGERQGDLRGEMVQVRIDHTTALTLQGELVDGDAPRTSAAPMVPAESIQLFDPSES